MQFFSDISIAEIVSTVVYTGVGVLLMYFCWLVLDLVTPFSLRREISQERNMALAVVIAAMFIAIAIIIAAVIVS